MPLGRIIAVVVGVAALFWLLNAMGIVNVSTQTGNGPKAMPKAQDMDPWTRGEASFISLQYRSALNAYRDGLHQNPDHPQAAEAHYRIGKCLEELGETRDALAAYQQYVDKYPNDDATRVQAAQKRIALLSGGG